MMRKITGVLLLLALLLAGSAGLGGATPKDGQGSKEEAKAMIEKAAVWFRQQGREKTLAEITLAGTDKKGEFIDRDLYIFAYDFNGVVLAHGANPKLIGSDLINMQDADGRYLIRGLIGTAQKGSGWYYYKWSNPLTKKIEDKMAYVQKIDDTLWIGCGVYGKEVRPKKIGVLLFFDQAKYTDGLKGFMDQLAEAGYQEPAVKFVVENAGGSQVKVAELVGKLAAANLDLVLALGTSAAVAVAREIKEVPVVFSVVYDPVEAKIAAAWNSSGNNTTGTSTRVPFSLLLQHLQELAPVKRLAVLYTPGEKNSDAQLKELQGLQGDFQLKVVPVPMARRDEVEPLMASVVYTTDAIFLTGSSVVYEAVADIVGKANQGKLITITHLEDLVAQGALLGVCVDNYMGGRLAGEKAIKILQGAAPASIPIETPGKIDLVLNLQSKRAGRFPISAAFMQKVTKTIP